MPDPDTSNLTEGDIVAEQAVKQIRVAHLHPAAFHFRTIWGDMTALRDSIADHGIIQPLVVRDRKAGGYEIVCGVRRQKAAVMADLKTAPCLVVEIDDLDAIAMQVAENLGREGMHPIDAAAYFDELQKLGLDHGAIAKRFQIKKRDVVRRLKLLALSAPSRKAFIAGKFDEDAALALARLSDAGRQRDVLAALDAGSLQPEEITSYVQREFTASLEDVPWRQSDEKLVTKAGSCTACHKRSDVQRDLFGADQKGLRCLDVDCFKSKMDATWQIRSTTPDVTIMDQIAHNLFVPTGGGARPVVLRSSGMVDADASCPYMIGHTWREATAKSLKADAEKPSEYVARDQDGRPRYLLRESVVAKMVRKSDAAKELAASEAARDPVRPEEEGPSPRAEAKVRRLLIAKLAERSTAGDADTWGWVTERVLDGASARAVAAVASLFTDPVAGLAIEGLSGKLGLIELARSSNRQARRIATAVMVFDEADLVGEISAPLLALAEACGIDLAVLEREIRGAS